jgi:adenine-specific DNA glycosylase
LRQAYAELATVHLKTHKRPPSKIEIQRIPLAFLLLTKKFTPGQLDDGLMHVGTKFCFNHSEPACSGCPIRDLCEGHRNNRALIEDYRT